MSNLPRTEHPRPDFARECWMTLNGEWDFSIANDRFDQKIIVPFACECTLSGIGDTSFHPVVWYRRQFKIPSEMHGKHILLHFGAVDYSCNVWVNGALVKEHTGGQSSFEADITHAIRRDEEIPKTLSSHEESSFGKRNPEASFTPVQQESGKVCGWRRYRRHIW